MIYQCLPWSTHVYLVILDDFQTSGMILGSYCFFAWIVRYVVEGDEHHNLSVTRVGGVLESCRYFLEKIEKVFTLITRISVILLSILLYLISSCFFGIFLHLHTLAILGSWVQTDGTTSQYKIGSWHWHLVSLFRDNMGQAKATSSVHSPHRNWHHPQAHALSASISESPRGGSRFPEALSLRCHPRLMDGKMGKKRMEQINYK